MTDRSKWTPEQFEQERATQRIRYRELRADPDYVANHNGKRRARHAKSPEKKREYDKKWAAPRRDHPEFRAARRAASEAWNARNPGKAAERARAKYPEICRTPIFVAMTRRSNKKHYEAKKDDPAFKAANRLRVKKWNEEHPGHKVSYDRERRRNNPKFRMECTLRARLRVALRRAIAKKSANTFNLVGCTPEALVAHLEAKFRDGMCWDNYGSFWHVDHKRPCCTFDLSDATQQLACFNWKNLQPLLVIENLTKHGRFIEESRAA